LGASYHGTLRLFRRWRTENLNEGAEFLNNRLSALTTDN
jgi:hypothetical protein